MVVDLRKNKGGQLALGERFILVEGLTVIGKSVGQARGYEGRSRGADNTHLAQSTSDLGPDGVDIIVESLQGKDLEFGLLVGEEAQHSSCCDKAGHSDWNVGSLTGREVDGKEIIC